MPRLRHGHAPGHLRGPFIDAIGAYQSWEPGEPEPAVTFEVNYEPTQITISKACGLLWNCNDILPGIHRDDIEEMFGPGHRGTYAAAAQLILVGIKDQLAAA